MNLKTMMRTAGIGGLAAIATACAPMATRAEPTCDPYGFEGATYVRAGDELSGEVAGRAFGYETQALENGGMRVLFESDGRRASVVLPSNVALIGEYGEMRPNVSPDSEGNDRVSLPVVGCGYVDVVRASGDREGIGRGGRLEPVAARDDGAVLGYLTVPFGPGMNRLIGGR
jgi:hypothetical protein